MSWFYSQPFDGRGSFCRQKRVIILGLAFCASELQLRRGLRWRGSGRSRIPGETMTYRARNFGSLSADSAAAAAFAFIGR